MNNMNEKKQLDLDDIRYTMKGLEFDIVLIPRIDQISTSNNQIIDNNGLYVATTRANEELYCFYLNRNGGNSPKAINTMREKKKIVTYLIRNKQDYKCAFIMRPWGTIRS